MTEKPDNPSSASFEKRVKRRILSRVHTFYASCAPGLIGLLEKEVKGTLGVNVTRLTGGVGFDGRLEVLWQAALSLRFANRILVRLAEFKTTDFRKLESRCREIPWQLWLSEDAQVEVTASAHQCRLYHSGAIEERVAKVVEASLAGDGQGVTQRLMVRGEDDRFTLSLDACGEPLYKRDIKIHGGRAPIRETLASAILSLAGYTGAEPLVDPMCGTGTFSLEAALLATNTAPGISRRFAFEAWPSFRPKRFGHIRQGCRKEVRKASSVILASDGDSRAVFRLKDTLEGLSFAESISVSTCDFFDLSPPPEKGVIVFNPPYGKRIGGGGTGMVHRLLEHLHAHWDGWRIAIAVPTQQISKPLPKGFSIHPMAHGGLELSVLTGGIPPH